MKRTSMFFPQELLDAYRRIADKRGTPMAEVMRAALEAWLKAYEAKHGTDRD